MMALSDDFDPAITIREKDLRDAWLRLDAVGDPRTAHSLWQHLSATPDGPPAATGDVDEARAALLDRFAPFPVIGSNDTPEAEWVAEAIAHRNDVEGMLDALIAAVRAEEQQKAMPAIESALAATPAEQERK